MAERTRGNDAPPDVKRVVFQRLNDFIGVSAHRALLETRPQGEPYPHERHRPIPLYLRGAGVAQGRYHDLLARALEILDQRPIRICSPRRSSI